MFFDSRLTQSSIKCCLGRSCAPGLKYVEIISNNRSTENSGIQAYKLLFY